jgi:hypothetical protein
LQIGYPETVGCRRHGIHTHIAKRYSTQPKQLQRYNYRGRQQGKLNPALAAQGLGKIRVASTQCR